MLRRTLITLSGLLLLMSGRPAQAVAPIRLTGCTDIRQSGLYTLDRDISGSVGMGCVQILNVADVQLDCRGHSITTDASNLAALVVQAADNFTITGCSLPQLTGFSLYVGNSFNGTIARNSLRDVVVEAPSAPTANSLRIVGNEFSEFSQVAPGAAPVQDVTTGVIPVAEGVNWIMARHILIPGWPLPAGPAAAVLPEIKPTVYPNPWRADRHGHLPLTFDQLPPNSTLKIFTVSAHAVRTLQSAGSNVTWDLRNNSGDPAASGIYLYLVTDDQGRKATGKFTVIR